MFQSLLKILAGVAAWLGEYLQKRVDAGQIKTDQDALAGKQAEQQKVVDQINVATTEREEAVGEVDKAAEVVAADKDAVTAAEAKTDAAIEQMEERKPDPEKHVTSSELEDKFKGLDI